MASVQHSIRIPEELEERIEEERRRRGDTDWSEEVVQLLDEAIRMRRAPGIIFVDGVSGRRAIVAGTGLEVWEVVAAWNSLDRDWEALRSSFSEITEVQLRAALSYYELYPDEIDERLGREEEWTPERIRAELPFSAPPTLS